MLIRIPTIEVTDDHRKAINFALGGDPKSKASIDDCRRFILESVEAAILEAANSHKTEVDRLASEPKPPKESKPRQRRYVIGGDNE